jgi:hypothetical protein
MVLDGVSTTSDSGVRVLQKCYNRVGKSIVYRRTPAGPTDPLSSARFWPVACWWRGAGGSKRCPHRKHALGPNHLCVYVCMYVCCRYVCVYVHVCIHVCACLHLCLYQIICMYVCSSVCFCLYVCLTLLVCMYLHLCVYVM